MEVYFIFIYIICIVWFDDVNKIYDVMFGDKVSDDWIYGRIFFDIWWVN